MQPPMHHLSYRLATERAAGIHAEMLRHKKAQEPRPHDHKRSWSSVAFWHFKQPRFV